jgi:hypothetical protein
MKLSKATNEDTEGAEMIVDRSRIQAVNINTAVIKNPPNLFNNSDEDDDRSVCFERPWCTFGLLTAREMHAHIN